VKRDLNGKQERRMTDTLAVQICLVIGTGFETRAGLATGMYGYG